MSIPPLVCSTPPPPDQCEDDKDPEDFEIRYHLSQDDDDDRFDFGSFSTYNHYRSSQNKSGSIEIIEHSKIEDSFHEPNITTTESIHTNIIPENKLEFDGELNEDDEDLNLEDLKVGQVSIEILDGTNKEADLQTDDPTVQFTQKVQATESSSNFINPDDFHLASSQLDEFVVNPSLDHVEDPSSYVEDIIAAVDNIEITATEPAIETKSCDVQITPVEPDTPIEESSTDIPTIEKTEINEPESIEQELPKQEEQDDDFGDFDDFQFAGTVDKPLTLDGCDNPWDNNNYDTDNDFGDFKATFEETPTSLSVTANENSSDIKLADKIVETAPVIEPADNNDNDDFGDFNDFQSTAESRAAPTLANLTSMESEKSLMFPHIPIINLQSPDDEEKLNDTITSVINSIFEDEITEPEEQTVVSLETVLGVTWGHLLEIDERQPYMVNWNNCLAQKTLLKALCIDSRNILFGPKWNYNMPKYAATLSAAPLQPQKQTSSPVTLQGEPQEKSASKPSSSWKDPFSSDGQESCSPDATTETPVMKPGPTDLDVFEASTSSKPDKIYSSTLNVQPLRQISLPDTHIFTPTDSETPRSTTIHYDNSPAVLMPQTIVETSKSDPSFKSDPQILQTQSSSNPTAESDDYWEYQDFRGPHNTIKTTATSSAMQTTEASKSNPIITYATQVLQPIKVEPIVPTLNWPDPGKVKESFDDFSDFVSSTSLINPPPTPQTSSLADPKVEIKPTELDLAGTSHTTATSMKTVPVDTGGDFDDEFDTFQSAQPSTSSSDFNFSSRSTVSNAEGNKTTISPQAPPRPSTDFEFAFQKVETVKSDTISFENINKPKDNFVQNQTSFVPNNVDFRNQPLPLSGGTVPSSGLLQPTPTSSNTLFQNHQKSGQILQPLSLESFSQINWPNPGIDLQDLSRFNPVETLHSLKSDLSVNIQSKIGSPVHSQKSLKNIASNQLADDDWGEFVSIKPKPQLPTIPKKLTTFADDDEWSDFVSSPSVKPPQNGLSTISLNVHTNFQSNPNKFSKGGQPALDIPTLNYITPKSSSQKAYNDRHLNL